MLVSFGLLLVGWGYARGTRALWRAAGRGRGVRTWQAVAFGAGLLTLGVALSSPLDALADEVFAVHMAQHLLLMVVAAPLLALGGAQVVFLWTLPRGTRVMAGRIAGRLRWTRALTLSLPLGFAMHSLALWLWHAPPLYEGALRNGALHALEHLVLLGTGVLFWAAAFNGLLRAGRTLGASVLFVFALGAQCTGLGALITLSTRAWYPVYAATSPARGLAAMDDQVLAGGLMWVPAGFVYLAFALLLLGAWLRPPPPVSRAESGPRRQPRAHLPGGPAPR